MLSMPDVVTIEVDGSVIKARQGHQGGWDRTALVGEVDVIHGKAVHDTFDLEAKRRTSERRGGHTNRPERAL